MKSLRDTLNAEAVLPTGGFLDLFEARIGRVTHLRAANIFEPGEVQAVCDGFEVPHPEVGAVAEPCTDEAGEAARAAFDTKECGLHKGIGVGVVADEVFEVRQDKSKDAARDEVAAGVIHGALAVLTGEVLEHVRAIDAGARLSMEGQPFDNVAIPGVLRENGEASESGVVAAAVVGPREAFGRRGAPSIHCLKDATHEWESLDTQGGACIKVEPTKGGRQAAAVLGVNFVVHGRNTVNTTRMITATADATAAARFSLRNRTAHQSAAAIRINRSGLTRA
jgi:hypothetical protein